MRLSLKRSVCREADHPLAQVISLCMGEVFRCQYFISMLGVRYGWSQNTKVSAPPPGSE